VADAACKLPAGDTVSFQIVEGRIRNSMNPPKLLVVSDFDLRNNVQPNLAADDRGVRTRNFIVKLRRPSGRRRL
jgi:hypothetical protein